jgi:hypothetical protein
MLLKLIAMQYFSTSPSNDLYLCSSTTKQYDLGQIFSRKMKLFSYVYIQENIIHRLEIDSVRRSRILCL